MIGIYVRISDDDQSKYSIADQLEQCKERAKTNDVIEYIDDGITASILERPALTKLREDVSNRLIEKVICWDPDRLARNLMHQLIIVNEIEKHATLEFINHSYTKTAEGALFFQMRGAISEFEKAKIAQRTTGGRVRKAKEGKVVKNSKMYGYNFDTNQSTYVINEEEAKIVRMIFDLFTRPSDFKGINGIALYLTETGVPTKKGAAVWHRQVVRQILMNEAYTGLYTQHKWNTEGMVGNKYRKKEDRVSMKVRPKEEWLTTDIPTIIEREQFEYAQMLLSESRRRYTKQAVNTYLLSGIVRCGKCGNTMTGRLSHNWGKKVPQYSDVKNTAGTKNPGCGNKIYAHKIDPFVWESVVNWLNNVDEIAASAEESVSESYEISEIERIKTEIEKIRTKRKNLIKLFSSLDDESDQNDVKDEMKELSEKEKKLNEKIKELEEKMSNVKDKEFSKKIFMDAAEYYLTKGIDELSLEDKKNIIRTVVKEVRVFDDRIDIYTF